VCSGTGLFSTILAALVPGVLWTSGTFLARSVEKSPVPQAPPTEIYVARLSIDAFPLTGGTPTNISNNPGYDNQPSFLPDGSGLLFSSNRDGKQTDIYRYDFATQALTQLTRTPDSEYSPIVTPDRKTFSVVRQETDGTQRLWRFDLDGSNPRLVFETVKQIGYHAWIDDTHLALFVLGGSGEPNTLQLADVATGKTEVVDKGIGRSLQIRPRTGTLTYVSKPLGAHWIIKELDPKTRAIVTLTETVDDNTSEDFTWHQARPWLLMGQGAKIFGWNAQGGWREVGAYTGIGRITRLAAAPFVGGAQPRLALVAEPAR
jgi:dipeptidyl aminopeptidase/acylaminoacyl peptidase